MMVVENVTVEADVMGGNKDGDVIFSIDRWHSVLLLYKVLYQIRKKC